MDFVTWLNERMAVDEHSGCWVWNGPENGKGYGRTNLNGRLIYAHRETYTHFIGPIPAGKVLDHLCRNPCCVNPSHLEPVSHQENIQRGKQGMQTHCKWGHLYTPASTGYHNPAKKNGRRYCRTCKNARRRKKE